MHVKQTLAKTVRMSGTGVHSGKQINLIIEPSLSGKIIFHRSDINGYSIPADAFSTQTRNSTALIHKGQVIQTIEHLMASFFLLGIDSADVIVDGPEIPVIDGSAAPFIQKLQDAGLRHLEQPRIVFDIMRPFSLCHEEGVIAGFPDPHLRLTYEIDFKHPMIGRQTLSLSKDKGDWIKAVGSARTFGFFKDADTLKKQKLALGASLENTLVLDEKKIINGPLRFKDEFVRHKLLDLMGDFFLLNGYLKGHIQAKKAGHTLHIKAVRYLLSHREIMQRRE
jgi:UDP-3-O-[3-hydroxymyristoyl] N-acetylglucosamine deacetylase